MRTSIVVCLPGARIEHVTERVGPRADHGTWTWRDPTSSHRDEQRRQGRNNSDSEEIQKYTEEDEGSEGWTDYLIRDFTSVFNQEPRIQKFEEDDSQRNGEAAV